jgi:hypothetical protein
VLSPVSVPSYFSAVPSRARLRPGSRAAKIVDDLGQAAIGIAIAIRNIVGRISNRRRPAVGVKNGVVIVRVAVIGRKRCRFHFIGIGSQSVQLEFRPNAKLLHQGARKATRWGNLSESHSEDEG